MRAPTAESTVDLEPVFARIFPLPLTTIESFMFTDAVPDFPMMADLELHFQGNIDRSAFDSALALALARAPLFRSVVQPHHGKLSWVLTNVHPDVDWAPLGTPLGDQYDTLIDLTSSPAFRVWVRHGLERSTVRLHFHHACADAIGGFAFIEDLLAGYAMAFPDHQTIRLRPIEPERLSLRGNPGTDQRGVYRGMLDTMIGAREGLRFFLQKPVFLSRPVTSSGSDSEDPAATGFVTHSLGDSVTRGLRRAASAQGVSVNDLLIRDLFVTLMRWNMECGNDPGRRNLRILMPQNLRNRGDRALPATNLVGFAFVTRRNQLCHRPQQLLQSIGEETTAVRQGQLSRYFLGGLAAIESVGFLPRLLRSSVCLSTAVLTNLGDPQRRFITRFPRVSGGLAIGNLVFERVEGVPPLRPGTRAAFCIFKDRRSLSMSVKCDPHSFSVANTRRLIGMYHEQLAVTAEGASSF